MNHEEGIMRTNKSIVTHLCNTRTNAWGGHNTTSLCGRLRTVNDGMNVTDKKSEVTCKFCLKAMARRMK